MKEDAMTEEIKVGDTVRLLFELHGVTGRVAKVVEVFQHVGLKSYDVSCNGVVTAAAAYEVEKIEAVMELVHTLEELEDLPEDTKIWSASEGDAAGTGKPYLQRGFRGNGGTSVWYSYSEGGIREGHQIQLPALVVYRPVAEIAESVKQ